ncbi:MAG: hypothetical protein EOM19_06580 [Candidatus Moranbacteria bacterium]|nr:hypothetical protein [Candidatus Moranbacteria bacterium]
MITMYALISSKHLYEQHQSLFPIVMRDYHEEWEKISQIFYSKVETLTEIPWAFPKYNVILSAFHRGISNRNDNIVFRWIFDDPKDHSRITAHEILMIHMWKVFECVFGERVVAENENFFWGANEITTVAILGLEQDINILWSKNQQGFDQFLLDYSQISDLKGQLEQRYRNKTSFREYVEGLQEFF